MLALLISLVAVAGEPVEEPPICRAGIVVHRVDLATVDPSTLQAVHTRRLRQTPVVKLADEAALVVEGPSRVAAR